MSQLKNNSTIKLKSIILCAGEGTRISDFIPNKPKPLIEINHKPILSYLIFNLIKSHITSIVIVTGYLKEQIENYMKEINQKDHSLRNKIKIIDSGYEYKKGPLYSFLSITNDKSVVKKDFTYLVFPGDTFFEFNLINELITTIKNDPNLFKNNSFLFYQELQGSKLKITENPSKKISTIVTKKLSSTEIVMKIEQIEISSMSENLFYKRIIPVFVFDFEFIEHIIDAEKKVTVKTLREIVNILIKEKKSLNAYRLNPNYRFFDIDTKLDLINLKK
ncbi:MAG: sugar phosphate nucleotidyltransferase [Promethearchaeota archaeon]